MELTASVLSPAWISTPIFIRMASSIYSHRTKKEDVKRIGSCTMGILYFYRGSIWPSRMDRWQTDSLIIGLKMINCGIRHARKSSIFELEDTAEREVLYGIRCDLTKETFGLCHEQLSFTLPMNWWLCCSDWVAQTVWYQIFLNPFLLMGIQPFHQKDYIGHLGCTSVLPMLDFFGGDLRGLSIRPDYLQELGITGLYLCFDFWIAQSNHKYDTIDYFKNRSTFIYSDKETFPQVVTRTHARGMKIMLDAVFNHIGYDSPQWQDVVKHRENSRFTKDLVSILKKFPVSSENLWRY